MKNMVVDPVTGNENVKFLAKINTEKLIKGYKDILDIDISHIVTSNTLSLYESKETGYIFYEPPLMGDALFYQKLETFPWYYAKDKWEHKKGLEIIESGSVLEIGCGNGEFLKKLQLRGQQVTGIDFNKNAIAKAKESGIETYKMTAKEYRQTTNKKFDNIVLFQILEHIPNIKDFFDDILELLNNKGKIIIAVPNNASLVFDYLDKDSYSIDAHLLNMPPHHAGKWTEKSLNMLAALNGLTMTEVHYEPLYLSRLEMVAQRIIKKYIPFLKTNAFVFNFVLRWVKKNRNKLKGDTILVAFTK